MVTSDGLPKGVVVVFVVVFVVVVVVVVFFVAKAECKSRACYGKK